MVNYDFLVIGANGMQGKIVAKDLLLKNYKVMLSALDDYGLDEFLRMKNAGFVKADLRRLNTLQKAITRSKTTTVVNCAIEDYNLEVTKLCLNNRVNYVDLGSWDRTTYPQMALDKDFKKNGLTAVIGMGSTPGINNVMLRHVKPQFDTIHTVHLGFAWDSNMKTFVPPFSIDTIAWEFREKANLLEDGKFVKRDPEECKFDYVFRGVGKQKIYYVDHMEPFTFHEYLKDVGIKNIAVCASFPEHSREVMNMLIDLGFTKWGQESMIELDDGFKVEPTDCTAEILRRLPIPEGYKEKECLWLKVYGKKDGKDKLVEMDALAETLPGWEDATCNIDTGIPVSITAEMINDGRISEHGVFPPEFIVPPQTFFNELAKYKIWVYENGKKINGPSKARSENEYISLNRPVKSRV